MLTNNNNNTCNLPSLGTKIKVLAYSSILKIYLGPGYYDCIDYFKKAQRIMASLGGTFIHNCLYTCTLLSTIRIGLSIIYLKGSRIIISNNIVFCSLKGLNGK